MADSFRACDRDQAFPLPPDVRDSPSVCWPATAPAHLETQAAELLVRVKTVQGGGMGWLTLRIP